MNDLLQMLLLALFIFVILPAILIGSIAWVRKNKKKGHYTLNKEALKNGLKSGAEGGTEAATREAYKIQSKNNFVREALTQYEEENGTTPPREHFLHNAEAWYDYGYCKGCSVKLEREHPKRKIGRTINGEFYCCQCSEDGLGGDDIVMVTNNFAN